MGEVVGDGLRLEVDGLTVGRGGRQVLDGVSFSLKGGEALFLTGPNGVGKSTLIRALLGLTERQTGAVRVIGAGEDETDVGRHCHYLGHRDALKTALTCRENLSFWRDFLGSGGAAIEEALDVVNLGDLIDLPAAFLSAGQRRRLSIARLLVVHRPIWLLDEPTAALDAASEAGLVDLMKTHLGSGGLIVAATHLAIDLPRARQLRLEPADEVEAW